MKRTRDGSIAVRQTEMRKLLEPDEHGWMKTLDQYKVILIG